MKTIDRLTDAQVLALARFIAGCARLRSSSRWRSHFAECAKRDHFLPYSTLEDQKHLREMIQRRGELVVCRLRTVDVIEAGNEVAKAHEQPPVLLAVPERLTPAFHMH